MSRKQALTALSLTLAVAMLASPASALDDGLEDPNGCSGPYGDVHNGEVIVLPAGLPPSSDSPPIYTYDPTTGQLMSNNVYQCQYGHWVLVTSALEAPLTVAPDATSVTVPEGSAASMTGTYQYAGEEPLILEASFGIITDLGDGTWSWTSTPDDGPATSTVRITVTAGANQASTGFDLTVDNVAPIVASVVPSSAIALTGQPVTFRGTATDPSGADTTAGFSWSFDGPVTFDTCGSRTVDATATDKDGSVSAPATSTAFEVVDARFEAPLTPGARNVVRAGQIVPVRLSVGCDGIAVGGLAPGISLVKGDVDPATSSDDPALIVPSADATGENTGAMHQVGDSYLYNLRVPDGPSGILYTVRVRPAAGTAPLNVVLQLR
jgi:hypothetical protein